MNGSLSSSNTRYSSMKTGLPTVRKANGERRKRTHRLITRGAVVESVAPTVKVLTEVEFYAFAESVFALPEVQTLLAEAIHAHDQGRT